MNCWYDTIHVSQFYQGQKFCSRSICWFVDLLICWFVDLLICWFFLRKSIGGGTAWKSFVKFEIKESWVESVQRKQMQRLVLPSLFNKNWEIWHLFFWHAVFNFKLIYILHLEVFNLTNLRPSAFSVPWRVYFPMKIVHIGWWNKREGTGDESVGSKAVIRAVVAEELIRVVLDMAVGIVRVEALRRRFVREHELAPNVRQRLLFNQKRCINATCRTFPWALPNM